MKTIILNGSPKGIVQYCQCQRNALDDAGGEIDERYDAEQSYGIAPSGDDAYERIQIVTIHIAR